MKLRSITGPDLIGVFIVLSLFFKDRVLSCFWICFVIFGTGSGEYRARNVSKRGEGGWLPFWERTSPESQNNG